MYTDWKKEIKVFVIADDMAVWVENPKELTIMTPKLLEVKGDSGKVAECKGLYTQSEFLSHMPAMDK